MRLFPSEMDVRDKPGQLGRRLFTLAFLIFGTGAVMVMATGPAKYFALAIGFALVVYTIALVSITNRHQRKIVRETISDVISRIRERDSE